MTYWEWVKFVRENLQHYWVHSDFCLHQSLTSDMSQLGISEDISPPNLERFWNRFMQAQQERDMALQAEIVR